MNIKTVLKKRNELINEYLKIVLPFPEEPKKLHEATWYCMLNGGKRIRANIMLAIAELAEVPLDQVLNSAAGIEMIHTSTLILDDLPSMDDALLRRGKPALHRVFGGATTILVANVLLLEGVKLILEDLIKRVEDKQELYRISSTVISSFGKEGIMLGQFLDLTLSNKKLKLSQIERIYEKKTAELFKTAAQIAGVLVGLKGNEFKAITDYAHYFGLAFQISDDIIAFTNKPAISGKLSLTKEKRPSYINACGKKETQKKLNNYVSKAIKSVKIFKNKAEFLIELVAYLKSRTS